MSIQDAVDCRAATRQAPNAQFHDLTLSWTGKNAENANTGGAAHFATAQAQISESVTPHTLRHLYATKLLEAGVD